MWKKDLQDLKTQHYNIKESIMVWEKGKSGNPSGRPGGLAEVNWKALKACPRIMDELIELALDRGIDNKVRITAMKEVLDRGLGKPIQALRIEDSITKEPSKMATNELEILLQGGIDILKEELKQQITKELLGAQVLIEKSKDVVNYDGQSISIEVKEDEMGNLESKIDRNVTNE